MKTGNQWVKIFTWFGVVLLQIIMTQVVTFIISLFLPGMENFPQTHPVVFIILLGISFTLGVFLVGWLALKWRWMNMETKFISRLVGTLIGAYLPLIIALIFFHPLEAGNPFFFISILASVAGFFISGYLSRT